jgi:hypothetical protein
MLTSIRDNQVPATDPRRRGQWLWTLLHAQALLAGPADGAAENDYPRLTTARDGAYHARVP